MSFRERIEKNPTLFLLSALLAGFIAGFGAFEAIIRVAHLEIISSVELAVLKQDTNKRVSLDGSKSWIGLWETDTETYRNLRIRFTEINGKVTGTYRVPKQISTVEEGRIEGSMSGNELIGKWVERRKGVDIEGEIFFVVFDEGKSFLGVYTRAWEGNQEKHVWTGQKIE